MDPRERTKIPQVGIDAALAGLRADIWTTLPGIVVSYDVDAQTAQIQPTIQAQIQDKDSGAWSNTTLPVCLDVPVIFPGAGGYALTFPLKEGDEGVVLFSARCIDAFWQQGGVQPQAELRMHNLSDGMFIPGRISQPKKLANVSTTAPQLRNEDGSVYIEIQDGGLIKMKPGAAGVEIDGNLNVTGTITWPKGTFGGTGGVIDGIITATGDVRAGEGGADQVGLKTHGHPALNQPPNPGT